MYPSQQASTIGALLRMIQEDQSKNVAGNNPASEPSTALRQTVQGPLQSVEDPGSSRAVSVPPEGVTQTGVAVTPQQQPQTVSPVSPVVAPIAPTPPPSAPTAPAPTPVSQAPAVPPAITATPSATPTRASSPLNRPSTVATRIQAKPSTPQRARIGVPLATNIKSKPARFTA